MIIVTAKAHPVLMDTLQEKGYEVLYAPEITYDELSKIVENATGLVVTTRIKIDSAISSFDVPVHEGFDTVVFINSVNKRPDEVIICDLQSNEEYLIFYNACCGDFDFWIKDRNKRGKHELVTFSQIGNSPKKLLGGVLFEAAFLHPKRDVSLDGGYMRSAMFPNRFKIYVQEYLPESPDSTIASIIDPVSGKALMAFKDVDSKILSFNLSSTRNLCR